MKKGTCFVGASVIVLFAQLCYANLVVNGGFETDFDNSSTSPVYGSWMAASQAEGVGESDGIIPFEGSQMLHFLNPNTVMSPLDTESSIWQIIDISPFLGEISNGNAIAEMSARFNRVLGDSQTDTEFRIQIYAFAGNPDSFWSQYMGDEDLAHVSESIFTDGDITTWELDTAELVLPVNTEFVAIELLANENIFNNTAIGEVAFDGHYADAVTLTIVPEPATTYYVDALNGDDDNDGLSPETPFATIQKAIDSAYNGDTVIVADGTYTGPGNRDIDFLGKAITVRSESGPENCIIDCENSGRGFYFHSSEKENSVVDGFTITNGRDGGIFCFDSSPTINNCIISGNAARGGAGIRCVLSSPMITNCIISGNIGSGIYCGYSSPAINNCIISGNTDAFGGAIILWDGSNPTITNCTITDNSSNYKGGGIFCRYSSPTITNCTISGNSAGYGGGIYSEQSSPTITNCAISSNSAEYKGGGISNYRGNLTITNCLITGNSAGEDGGGIFCERDIDCDKNGTFPFTIANCTIAGNKASQGGGIGCWDSNPTITNCILWGNEGPNGPQIYLDDYSTPSVSYTNLKGGQDDVYLGDNCTLNWGLGNIDADPCFALSTDYHLMPDSLCIDAGDPNYTAEPNETDLDGNQRIITDRIDMGAYEYNPDGPPLLAIFPVSFSCAQPSEEIASQTLLIRNAGNGTLNWEIIEDCDWLQVYPIDGISTGEIEEITLTVDPSGLEMGYYDCILTVQDPDAMNSPRTITVNLHVSGETIYVPSQVPTIQDAIEHVLQGGTVIVADGTYTGDGNRDIDFLGKAITVRSENGPENCIIDCNGIGRGFYFHNNEDANSVLAGFTIINGRARDGGAVYFDFSNPTLTNCLLENNLAWRYGGCMYFNQSNPTLINCTISDNKALFLSGGGICLWASDPFISNCTFSGNVVSREGGGICLWSSNPTIVDCLITNNTAHDNWSDGGGIRCWGSDPTIINCTITGNSARRGGGGIAAGYYSQATVVNSIIWENADSEISGSGYDISYSDIKGGYEGQGNIDLDPCFVEQGYWDANGLWVDGDYHLLRTSPCIDAGADVNVYTDIEGNIRPFDFPGVDNNGDLPEFDMGVYEAMVSCFGVNHIKLGTKAGKKGNKVEVKGTFDPASPIDFEVDDVMYTIDDGLDYMLTFIIPTGSFELEGKGDKDKYKFHSPKGSVPEIEAKFDFDKCKFEFKAKKVAGIDEITSTSLEIILQAGANIAQEIVELEVKGKKGEHLEYKRKPKFECCPEM